jgi:hypothetical protein
MHFVVKAGKAVVDVEAPAPVDFSTIIEDAFGHGSVDIVGVKMMSPTEFFVAYTVGSRLHGAITYVTLQLDERS